MSDFDALVDAFLSLCRTDEHLPGQHDQADHAGGGGGGSSDALKKLKPEHADNLWVKHAVKDHVTDVGQLSANDKKALDAAVKVGVLKKGKGGVFNKTQYAKPDYNFEGETQKAMNELYASAAMDAAARTARKNQGGF